MKLREALATKYAVTYIYPDKLQYQNVEDIYLAGFEAAKQLAIKEILSHCSTEEKDLVFKKIIQGAAQGLLSLGEEV